MRGLKRCLWLVAVLLLVLTPLHSESCDKIAAKVVDFLIFKYSKEEIAEAVESSYGQHQGEDVFVGDLRKFLPEGATVSSQNINTDHGLPERGPDGETYRVCIKFRYCGRDFAYQFSSVRVSPGAPTVFKEVFLYKEKDDGYERIANLDGSFFR